MVEIGIDVQRNPVIADPMAHPDADRRDLVLPAIGAADPNPDPAVAPLAPEVEPSQAADHPFLEPPDMAAHVSAMLVQVEQHVSDPLSRPVIGVLPAAP